MRKVPLSKGDLGGSIAFFKPVRYIKLNPIPKSRDSAIPQQTEKPCIIDNTSSKSMGYYSK
jgi:hypothetical protein